MWKNATKNLCHLIEKGNVKIFWMFSLLNLQQMRLGKKKEHILCVQLLSSSDFCRQNVCLVLQNTFTTLMLKEISTHHYYFPVLFPICISAPEKWPFHHHCSPGIHILSGMSASLIHLYSAFLPWEWCFVLKWIIKKSNLAHSFSF